jgi:hypothetical protein
MIVPTHVMAPGSLVFKRPLADTEFDTPGVHAVKP